MTRNWDRQELACHSGGREVGFGAVACEKSEVGVKPLMQYLEDYEVVCLLFTYVRFIDDAGQL